MRLTLVFWAVPCLVAGCAITPPKPSPCQGDFRPVNVAAHQSATLFMSHADSLALCIKGAGHANQG